MATSIPATVTHKGACHCGLVRFEVDASPDLVVWDCNCSICNLKRNTHFVVPAASFRLLNDSDKFLTTYTFNTGVAKHKFCKACGVQAFYHPRSNPDGVAVTVWCITPGTIKSITTKQFDGQHWEDFIQGSGIQAFSK